MPIPTHLFTRVPRVLLGLGVLLGLLLVLLLLLNLTDSVLSVWQRMQETPVWFVALVAALFLVIGGGGSWLVWRLLVPRRAKPAAEPEPVPPPSEEALEKRLAESEAAGLDVAAIRRELEELKARRKAGKVYVAMVGEISTGKSSLIKALLPGARAETSPRGGTTREALEYTWSSPAGDQLILVDLPGLNEVGEELDDLTRREGVHAHLVIYVVDGDITRVQDQELKDLLAIGKPIILALNKIDLYTAAEVAAIKQRLKERLGDYEVEVVPVSAGGAQETVRVYPDGREETGFRTLPPRVEALRRTLQRTIDHDREAIESLRDSAVFVLAGHKLEESVAEHRREKARALVSGYTKKAVVGAMAAVAPGADLIIQGYLGMNLVRELCELYEISARKIDMQQFLNLASRHIGKTLTLILAVAGNGLKAFPGVGTLAGGLLHAVAYGLIFDSLGKAVAQTLETRGELAPAPTALLFEEKLGEDLESRARLFAKLALDARREKDTDKAS